jgi:hypothetical protein
MWLVAELAALMCREVVGLYRFVVITTRSSYNRAIGNA